ncbi:MAG: hypothetical protein U0841_18935 [Chloroflexia bacterium]
MERPGFLVGGCPAKKGVQLNAPMANNDATEVFAGFSVVDDLAAGMEGQENHDHNVF